MTRWRRLHDRRVAVGVAAILAVGALAVVVRIAHEPRAPGVARRAGASTKGCADALVVGIDGNGEQPRAGHGFGPTVDAVVRRVVGRAERHHHSVAVRSVPLTTHRPATILKTGHHADDPALHMVVRSRLRTWRQPVTAGVRGTLSLLTEATARCPDRPVLLVGYAQGASVVHRVLGRIDARAGLAGVIGGIVISDPDKVAHSVAGPAVGDPAAWRHRQGIFPLLLHAHHDVPRASGSYAVWSVCSRSDLICDPSRVGLRTALDAARGYVHDHTLLSSVAGSAWRQLALWPVPFPRRQVVRATVGQHLSVQLTLAPRAPGGTVWSDVSGVPSGLTLSPSGVLSGTPTRSGSFDVSYRTSGTTPVTTGHTGSVVLDVAAESVTLSAGGQDSCLTRSDGQAKCWGRNDFGQIGDGTTTRRDSPAKVIGTGWSSISTSGSTTCGIKDDGTLWCWGLDNYGQLGSGRGHVAHQPRQVGRGHHWMQVSSAWTHTCAVKSDGSLWCWGQNLRGQLGIGSVNRDRGRPQRVGTDSDWSSVTTGGWHTCALTTAGAAWCWGHNAFGELGDGTITGRNRPTQVTGSTTWLQLSAAWAQTCGVTRSGGMKCWGFNRQGQLGDGTVTNRARPAAVIGDQTWTEVTTGDGSTCGVDSSAALWCWGDDRYGQLGDAGSGQPTTTPARVAALTSPVQLTSAGWLHTCATPVGGVFSCWGNDEVGQLGNGTTGTIETPSVRHQVAIDPRSLPKRHFLDHASPGRIAARALGARPAARAATTSKPTLSPFAILSMNELGSQHTAPTGDSPEFAPGRIRAEWASILYREKDASLVGTQETQPDQIVALDSATRHEYRFYPGTTLGYLGAPQSVMWRRSEWRLTWKSSISIPFEKGWRPQPIVELKQKATGAKVYWANVHFSPGRQQNDRNKAMKILLAALHKLRNDGIPILLTGDFNEANVAFCDITGHTKLESAFGGSNTGGHCLPPPHSRIDWIFGSKGTFTGPVVDVSPQVRRTTDHAVMSATFGTG
jgi:alpha-tubulin suppressor-like RCC1 family protein/endonuclease/exonuclease/phosphatase family metal-dependent hydrolase